MDLNTLLDTNDFLAMARMTAHDLELQKEVLRVKSIHQNILLQMVYLVEKSVQMAKRGQKSLVIGFMGVGVLGRVLVNSVLRNGQGHKVLVSTHSETVSLAYSGMGVEVTSNQSILQTCDLIVLSMNNRLQNDQLLEIKADLVDNNHKLFFSMMPDLTHNKFASLCQNPQVSFLSPGVNYTKIPDLQALFQEQDNQTFLSSTRADKIEKYVCQHLTQKTQAAEIISIFCRHFQVPDSLRSFVREPESLPERETLSATQLSNLFQTDVIFTLRDYYAQYKHT